ncbi:hypothetical protein [Parvularcula mediterranea]|uniref:hypothetical protein n=1 Tax=Parvularcula mediterranea TaxID=2732508 RepID=UPI001564ADF4|nr:hypothetical protein [Parvularcula mediterranea]
MSDARSVADIFVDANSGLLMALYGVFFPEFLDRYNSGDGVRLLSAVRDTQTYADHANVHRIDALPAVAAVHYIPRSSSFLIEDHVEERLIAGLSDKRREVREIILQNLVSATLPNLETKKRTLYSEAVIDQAYNMGRSAMDEVGPSLTVPLFTLEFLLNISQLAILQNDRTKSTLALDRIRDLCSVDSRYQFVLRLVRDVHNEKFSLIQGDFYSLPPQSSELLMSWKSSFYSYARDYAGIFGVNRVALCKQLSEVASGRQNETEQNSQSQAAIALPKVIDFIDKFDIRSLIQSANTSRILDAWGSELTTFITDDLSALIGKKRALLEAVGLSEITRKELAFSSLAPFAQYVPKQRLVEASRQYRKEQSGAAGAGALAAAGIYASPASTFVGNASEATVSALFKIMTGKTEEEAELDDNQAAERVADILSDRESRIDAGSYGGVEEEQEAHGNLDLPEDLE